MFHASYTHFLHGYLLRHGTVERVTTGATSLSLIEEVPLGNWWVKCLIEAFLACRHLNDVRGRSLVSILTSRVECELPLVRKASLVDAGRS